MKKRVTIPDLEWYLGQREIRHIRYRNKKQQWFDDFGPVPDQDLDFSALVFTINPNCIMIHDGKNRVYFNGLKYAWIDDSCTEQGTLITLVKNDYYDSDKEVQYQLIVA